MNTAAQRVLAVAGGVICGFALGGTATAFVQSVNGNSATIGGAGIGLGLGLMVAALVRD